MFHVVQNIIMKTTGKWVRTHASIADSTCRVNVVSDNVSAVCHSELGQIYQHATPPTTSVPQDRHGSKHVGPQISQPMRKDS